MSEKSVKSKVSHSQINENKEESLSVISKSKSSKSKIISSPSKSNSLIDKKASKKNEEKSVSQIDDCSFGEEEEENLSEAHFNIDPLNVVLLSAMKYYDKLEEEFKIKVSFNNKKGVIIQGEQTQVDDARKRFENDLDEMSVEMLMKGKEKNKIDQKFKELKENFPKIDFIKYSEFRLEADRLDSYKDYSLGKKTFEKFKQKDDFFFFLIGKNSDKIKVEIFLNQLKSSSSSQLSSTNEKEIVFQKEDGMNLKYINSYFSTEVSAGMIIIEIERGIKYLLKNFESQTLEKVKGLLKHSLIFQISTEIYQFMNKLLNIHKINSLLLTAARIKLKLTKSSFDSESENDGLSRKEISQKLKSMPGHINYLILKGSKKILEENTAKFESFLESFKIEEMLFKLEFSENLILNHFKTEIDDIVSKGFSFMIDFKARINDHEKLLAIKILCSQNDFPFTTLTSNLFLIDQRISKLLRNLSYKEFPFSKDKLEGANPSFDDNLIYIEKEKEKTLVVSKIKHFNFDILQEKLKNGKFQLFLSPIFNADIARTKFVDWMKSGLGLTDINLDFKNRLITFSINEGNQKEILEQINERMKNNMSWFSRKYLKNDWKITKSINDELLSDLEIEFCTEIKRLPQKEKTICYQTPNEKKKLYVCHGDILESNADLIVVPVDESILNTGGLASELKSLLDPEFTISCTSACSSSPLSSIGDCILLKKPSTSWSKKNIQNILLVRSPIYKGDESIISEYKSLIKKVLGKADLSGVRRVTMPLIGCGRNEMPGEFGVGALLRCLIDYLNSMKSNVVEVWVYEREMERALGLFEEMKMIARDNDRNVVKERRTVFDYRWYWNFFEKGPEHYEPYDLTINRRIEGCLASGEKICDISDMIPAKFPIPSHQFDFKSMLATHLRLKTSHSFAREAPAQYTMMVGENKIKLNKEICEHMENYFLKNNFDVLLDLFVHNYTVDLTNLIQTNITTGFARKVERRKEKINLEEIYTLHLGQLDLDIKPFISDEKIEGFELISSDANKMNLCYDKLEEIINMNLKTVKMEARNVVKLEESILENICQFYGVKFNGIEGSEIKIQGLQEDINLFKNYIIKRHDKVSDVEIYPLPLQHPHYKVVSSLLTDSSKFLKLLSIKKYFKRSLHIPYENLKTQRTNDREIWLFCKNNKEISEKTKFSLKIENLLKSGRNEIIVLRGLVGKIENNEISRRVSFDSQILNKQKGKYLMVKSSDQVRPEFIMEIEA